MKEITITLPLPHKYLSPNYRVNRQGKARVAKKARLDAKLATCHAMNMTNWTDAPYWKSATVQTTVYKRTRQLSDADNMLSSCKAYFDGMADAGLIENDNGLTHLPVKFDVDKSNPRVELRVTKGDA